MMPIIDWGCYQHGKLTSRSNRSSFCLRTVPLTVYVPESATLALTVRREAHGDARLDLNASLQGLDPQGLARSNCCLLCNNVIVCRRLDCVV